MDVKYELIEGGISINELSKNNYLLNYAEYLKDNVDNETCDSDIIIKKLGEICDIDKKIIKHATEYGKSKGKYKFYTGGLRTDLYVDNYDIEDMYIIQNRTNGS